MQDLIEYAGFKPRALSWFIDITLCLFLSSLFTWILALNNNLSAINVLTLLNLLNFSISFSYFWLFESYNHGQTLGKLIFKLRTVDAITFESANLGSYAINNFTRGTFFFLLDVFLGLIANKKNIEKKIRITQNAANTVVIKVK
ncbi:MAG: RDD family protein [Promethearchaeota archaeon]